MCWENTLYLFYFGSSRRRTCHKLRTLQALCRAVFRKQQRYLTSSASAYSTKIFLYRTRNTPCFKTNGFQAIWNFAYLESNRALISQHDMISKLEQTLASATDSIFKKNIEGILFMFSPPPKPVQRYISLALSTLMPALLLYLPPMSFLLVFQQKTSSCKQAKRNTSCFRTTGGTNQQSYESQSL